MFSLKIFSLIPFYVKKMTFVGCFEFGDQKMLLTMGSTQALCDQKIIKYIHTHTHTNKKLFPRATYGGTSLAQFQKKRASCHLARVPLMEVRTHTKHRG